MVRHNNTSIIEEIFNAVTHGLGIVLSIVGWLILLNLAGENKNKIIGFSAFGIVIIFSYLVSTLYHSLSFTKAQKVLRILDHSCIFLLIAGTYTPFMLVALKGQFGLTLLTLIWIITIVGIFLKIFYVHKFKKLSLILYIFMGWFAIIGIKPLLESLSINAIYLLTLGGILYTSGIIFYSLKQIYFNHAVWHLFVLGGSICHFFAMFYL
ncbi:MAG: hemolysin III family protein [Candidatus Levybacteria bacterium]|nr:hemolysin III family protein [Candidatus Levybacteria bacterium]